MLENTLRDIFGYSGFKSVHQEEACREVIEGNQDIIVCLQSHGGKSLCYQLAGSLENSKLMVIITPSLAFINFQLEFLARIRLLAVSINSELNYDEKDEIKTALQEGVDGCNVKFLFLTPEMLVQEDIWGLITKLSLKKVISHLFIDDVHFMMNNENFRHAFTQLKILKQSSISSKWIALTNTSNPNHDIIANFLGMDNPSLIMGSCIRTDIFHDVFFVDPDADIQEKILLDIRSNQVEGKFPSVLIYVNMTSDADALANYLSDNAIPSKAFYGDKQDRNIIQKEWMDNKFPVLVATFASFGVGIVKIPLRFIYHYKSPISLEDYIQASGRGCGINKALVTSRIFYTHFTYNVNDRRPIDNYLLAKGCRRRILGEFVGEVVENCRYLCDNCVTNQVG